MLLRKVFKFKLIVGGKECFFYLIKVRVRWFDIKDVFFTVFSVFILVFTRDYDIEEYS